MLGGHKVLSLSYPLKPIRTGGSGDPYPKFLDFLLLNTKLILEGFFIWMFRPDPTFFKIRIQRKKTDTQPRFSRTRFPALKFKENNGTMLRKYDAK